jgi:hypothetical protein
VPDQDQPAPEPAPLASDHLIFTEEFRQRCLEQLRRDHGEAWVREHRARLDEEWEYLHSL